MLEQVVALDPGFISAVYRLAAQYQRMKQYDKAKLLFIRFKELKEAELTGGTFTVLKAYGTVVASASPVPMRVASMPKLIARVVGTT